MRYYCLIVLLIFLSYGGNTQSIPPDFLKKYTATKTDNEKFKVMIAEMSAIREDTNFISQAHSISKYFFDQGDINASDFVKLYIYEFYAKTGDYVTGLNESLEILKKFEERNHQYGIMFSNTVVGICYYHAHDKDRTLAYDRKALELAEELNDPYFLASSYNNLSADLMEYGYLDSGIAYLDRGIKNARIAGNYRMLSAVLSTQGAALLLKKDYRGSLQSSREALVYGEVYNILAASWSSNDIAQIYIETDKFDSAMLYARNAIHFSSIRGFKDQLTRGYEYLSICFENSGRPDSALKYLRLRSDIKDSLITSQKTKEVQGIANREQLRLQEAEQDKLKYQNKIRIYGMLAAVIVFLLIALILFRNNKQKQNANKKLETTLLNLRETQTQLVHSEKMASLGELTAGIAHEIQNPLNFVNNFSEINKELLTEMKEEILNENFEEVNTIANSIISNEEKISHHGKRADAIVKGMLQHSRSSSGQKEPTDINQLADEYFRLAYHGLRAKDKSFNATLKSEFDDTIGKVNIIPQDIGRVILNLLTNAFYAVAEKKKLLPEGYDPTVTLITRKQTVSKGNELVVSVADNGNGIPPEALEKIFQPFFTTKPTGLGTGLGLSMSYDIITKGHGGQLGVDTVPGKGTTFTIILPL